MTRVLRQREKALRGQWKRIEQWYEEFASEWTERGKEKDEVVKSGKCENVLQFENQSAVSLLRAGAYIYACK